jgi:ATP-dependent Clp protease ATP-binding subunit ClpB
VLGAQTIREQLDKLKNEMDEAKRSGNWQKMSEIQYGQLPQLEAQLKQAEASEGSQQKNKLLRTQVGAEENR